VPPQAVRSQLRASTASPIRGWATPSSPIAVACLHGQSDPGVGHPKQSDRSCVLHGQSYPGACHPKQSDRSCVPPRPVRSGGGPPQAVRSLRMDHPGVSSPEEIFTVRSHIQYVSSYKYAYMLDMHMFLYSMAALTILP
jgi:hypothetical protein